ALIAISLLTFAGCGPDAPSVEQGGPPVVTVSQPLEREITDYDVYTGQLEAAEMVEVRARVRGELVGIHFKDGAIVKEGEPLYDIDPRTYKSALDAAVARKEIAKASLGLAESEYLRNEDLARSKAASQRDVAVWLAKKGVAVGEVSAAEAEI